MRIASISDNQDTTPQNTSGLPVYASREAWLATSPTVGSNALIDGVLYVCRQDEQGI